MRAGDAGPDRAQLLDAVRELEDRHGEGVRLLALRVAQRHVERSVRVGRVHAEREHVARVEAGRAGARMVDKVVKGLAGSLDVHLAVRPLPIRRARRLLQDIVEAPQVVHRAVAQELRADRIHGITHQAQDLGFAHAEQAVQSQRGLNGSAGAHFLDGAAKLAVAL